MSRIRANQITNQSADGAPVVQNGLIVTGVVTSTTFSGAFTGDGSALVGVASTDNIVTGTAATLQDLQLLVKFQLVELLYYRLEILLQELV